MPLALAHSSAAVQVDIEGSEFPLLDDFFKQERPMPFSEILIEFHVPKLVTGPAKDWGEDTPSRLRCVLPVPSPRFSR